MAKYVTAKDYFDFSGIQLEIELKGSNTDNPSRAADIFIDRVEQWCIDYLKFNYFVREFDEDAMKKGILHQIDYVRRHGDITLSSVEIKMLAPSAFMAFKMGGMCNTTLPRVPRRDPWV